MDDMTEIITGSSRLIFISFSNEVSLALRTTVRESLVLMNIHQWQIKLLQLIHLLDDSMKAYRLYIIEA